MLRELAHREGDGLAVTLAWDVEDDVVVLKVKDGPTSTMTTAVPHGSALDAFRHPFLYVTPEVDDGPA